MAGSLYVEQSLTSGEKIFHVGRFHWIYTLGALLWVVLGLGGCIAILAAGFTWDIRTDMRASLPNLPDQLFWQGWADSIAARGGYIAVIRDLHLFIRLGAFASLLLGIILFAHLIILRVTTEIAITSKRLVLKEGVVARRVDEMNIDRIESVHVNQSVMGRMLNYGTVMVRGMGIGEISLPPLAQPIEIRTAIEKAKYTSEARETW